MSDATPPTTRDAAGAGRAASPSPSTALIQRFNASVGFDRRLAAVDIDGLARARAHARRARHHLPRRTSPPSSAAWRRSATRSRAATFAWSLELEDVHLNIEQRLTELVGRRRQAAAHRALAQRPGRDRHAPVAARARSTRSPAQLRALRARARSTSPSGTPATIMPGFTHLQVAQPVTFGHHLMAYDAMFARDAERLADCRRRVNRLPLGAAALAGTSFPIDRERVARELGFDGVVRATRSTPCPIATSRSNSRRRAALVDGAPVALRRGAGAVVEPALRLRRRSPTASAPAARSCRRRRIPDVPELVRGKSGARHRPPGGAAHADEGPAARLQQGQPGGQGAAVRHRRHAARRASRSWPSSSRRARAGARARCARRRAKASPPRPTSPTTWCARACRSATRTKPSRARCATPRARGVDLAELPLAELQRLLAADRRRRLRGAHARRLGREPRPRRRHRAAARARGSAARSPRSTPRKARRRSARDRGHESQFGAESHCAHALAATVESQFGSDPDLL